MKSLPNKIIEELAWRRARRLAQRIGPLLATNDRVLDVGSGTGHNSFILRELGYDVVDTDVVDLHVVGQPPVPCQDGKLPFKNDAFDTATVLYVLQYSANPTQALREIARVAPRIVVLQSTYRGSLGRTWLAARELITGRLAFRIARWLRFIAFVPCPMDQPRPLTGARLIDVIADAGLRIVAPAALDDGLVSRELLVLERRP